MRHLSSQHTVYVQHLFACFCKNTADRTFVLADLGTGADALADTSTEALADALAATWARADPSADPRRHFRCAEIVTYLHLPCANSCHPVDKLKRQRPPHSNVQDPSTAPLPMEAARVVQCHRPQLVAVRAVAAARAPSRQRE
jgi:hypothetical protein